MNDQDSTNASLPAGDDQDVLEAGDDLALDALSQASLDDDEDAELATSNDLAETLSSLQNVIERSAGKLTELKNELKEKRESLKSVFENDIPLAEAKAQVDIQNTQLKERKAKLQSDPQVTSLKVQIGEINEQKKEIEESLSNHLINYYSLTNSTSFDTSDGDQWDFTVRAKVSSKKQAA